MNDVFIIDFWLKKYTPEIVKFIAVALEYEELTPEELEVKRKELLLDYLDTCESQLLTHLLRGKGALDVLERIYDAVYAPIIQVNDSVSVTDDVQVEVHEIS